MKILLCEDNEISARIATLVLTRFNHEVDLAVDGHEALDKFVLNTYDIILMDGMMPSMCGLETTKKIREIEEKEARETRVKILAFSADSSDENIVKCIQSGMDSFVEKPLRPASDDFIKTFVHNQN